MSKQKTGNSEIKPRNRWYSMKMANRIPEVDKENKMKEIDRFYAQFKRDLRIEQQELWDFLYDNELVLQESLARQYSLEDVLSKRVPLMRKWADSEGEPLPHSEVYRRFIIFKALTMRKIFGHRANAQRPNYYELYDKQRQPTERNNRNFEEIIAKYRCKSKTDRERAVEILAGGTPEVDGDSGSARERRSSRWSRNKRGRGRLSVTLPDVTSHSEPVSNGNIMASLDEIQPEDGRSISLESHTDSVVKDDIRLPSIKETSYLVSNGREKNKMATDVSEGSIDVFREVSSPDSRLSSD